ncbi:DNA polymerase beta superfamily protein [Streptomyces sp. NPDC003247]|uniref:nucleotidyltransferase domain-containing protein n=1 Tax=Streptomyces sp. NPDC003247 TaxID=3364677 RepID=UPI003685F841
MTVTVQNILLSGIVGSTAYGLAHAHSDIDRLGLFAAPTESLHGLHPPKESHVSTAPDRTLHEAAKWCRLALGGNPTVTELVWLPDDLYEVRTPLGEELLDIRTTFLSAHRVRDAYLGYATQQFRKLRSRGDGTFSADVRRRTTKHARHLKRLCDQGYQLYATGTLTVRLDDPDGYHRFGEEVAADPEAALPLLRRVEEAFARTRSVLPERPDETAADAWLRRVRRHFYGAEEKSRAVPRQASLHS